MKIAIASDDGKSISPHFGRTKGFVFVEVDGKQIKGLEYRLNTFTGHVRGLEHAGHQVDRHGPILEALQECSAVISHGMGWRIHEDLRNKGIKAFVTEVEDIQKAIELFLEGKLVDRTEMLHSHTCEKREG